MEHAIGTKITLEVVEDKEACPCERCFFMSIGCDIIKCAAQERTDHKDVIYKLIKEDKQ